MTNITTQGIYPWMQKQWEQLLSQYLAGRLPHAILFSGPEGIGKFDFAKRLSETLLCDKNDIREQKEIQIACGQCNGCQLIAAGTHPDSYILQPESEGKQIQIASIREINQFLSLKSQFAPLQVVIISPAEAMNRNSANALLKTLEEPQPGKLIILVSSHTSRLLPTIRSRCQQIIFSLPDFDQAMDWLTGELVEQADKSALQRLLVLAGGAPLQARHYAEKGKLELYTQLLHSFEKLAKNQADPVKEAKIWENAGLAHCVKWLYLWVSSLIHLKSMEGVVDTTDVDEKTVANQAIWREPSLDFLIANTSNSQLYGFLDRLIEVSRVTNTSVNVQLTLESLLIDWCHQLKT